MGDTRGRAPRLQASPRRPRPMPLGRRLRQQVGFGPAAPLDQHRGGVVLELAGLAVDDGVSQPAQRLGRGLAGGGLALDELAEPGTVNSCPSG